MGTLRLPIRRVLLIDESPAVIRGVVTEEPELMEIPPSPPHPTPSPPAVIRGVVPEEPELMEIPPPPAY